MTFAVPSVEARPSDLDPGKCIAKRQGSTSNKVTTWLTTESFYGMLTRVMPRMVIRISCSIRRLRSDRTLLLRNTSAWLARKPLPQCPHPTLRHARGRYTLRIRGSERLDKVNLTASATRMAPFVHRMHGQRETKWKELKR